MVEPLPVDLRPGRTRRGPRAPAASRPVDPEAHAAAGDDVVERPDATARPWWRITTRSQTCSTSVSRCELRITVAPRSRAARTIAADVGPADRVERRGRFVEEDQLGLAEQRHAEPEPLLHALREAADRGRRRGRPGRPGRAPRRWRLAPARWRHAGKLGVEAEDLAGAQPRLVAEQLGQVADPPPGGAIAERRAEDATGAARSGARDRAGA